MHYPLILCITLISMLPNMLRCTDDSQSQHNNREATLALFDAFYTYTDNEFYPELNIEKATQAINDGADLNSPGTTYGKTRRPTPSYPFRVSSTPLSEVVSAIKAADGDGFTQGKKRAQKLLTLLDHLASQPKLRMNAIVPHCYGPILPWLIGPGPINLEIAQVLLRRGADPEIRGGGDHRVEKQWTTFELAKQMKPQWLPPLKQAHDEFLDKAAVEAFKALETLQAMPSGINTTIRYYVYCKPDQGTTPTQMFQADPSFHEGDAKSAAEKLNTQQSKKQ